MVERIVVNPQEVRGLGNVVNDDKTKQDVDVFNSYVTTASDLIDGIRIGIMRMTYNDPNLLFSFNRLEKFLYVNSDEASLGWYNKKLTLDSDTLTVGFDADDKTLYVGTDTPPVVHDYSISFSQDSYTAVDGSAEVSCTLLDNGVAVSGATVTFTGGTSTVTGTTGSNGVATVTVTFNATGTVTATYESVSDTATVTVGPSYLFYDECSSSSGLSNYGTLHKLRVQNVDGALSYDSGMNAYKWTPTTANNDGFCDIPILALDNKNNYYVECEIYTTDTTTGGQPGLTIYPTTSTGGEGVFYRDIASINRCGVLKFTNWAENGESGNSQKSNLPVGNNWIRIRLEVNGTSGKGIWLKTDGTEIYNHTYTVPYTSSAMRVGITALLKSTSNPYYIRNVKAGYL